jgi:hypothetical protein
VGYYCIEGTVTPEACPQGTFSNQLKATDENFCMPCPPGYLCLGTGLSTPSAKCDAGTYCDDGETSSGCA